MRRLIRSTLTVLMGVQLFFFGVIPALALHDPPPDNATQVHNAVVLGRTYLLAQQNSTTGCWSDSDIVGHTALAMLAIMHSEPGGYAAQSASTKAAIDKGTGCILSRVQKDGPITDGDHRTYNTSIAIWALSDVPVTADVTAAITGGRTWLLANQRNSTDAAGRADAGGNQNNGGWYYEGGTAVTFVEHSNSSFALQGLEASGGIPAANADLAQGFFTCLQRRAPLCGDGASADGGFIYSHQLVKDGATQTSSTGSGSFALSLTGVAPTDARIVAAIAYLDASLNSSPCQNNDHTGTDLTKNWSATSTLIHYAAWANLKAHELAGIADDVNNTSNWFYKLANCLTNAQTAEGRAAGRFNASFREDDILATSFALLTLEKVTPEKQIEAAGKTIAATEGQSFSGAVASFTDADTNATAAEYTASIAWGDASTSAGTISGAKGGPFTVSGTHTYAEEKTYSVTVTITDADNATNIATATTTANVADAALNASNGAGATSTESVSTGTVTLATFKDSSNQESLANYSATVDWKDGATSTCSSTGTDCSISFNDSTGNMEVKSSHTYAEEGSYVAHVTIKDEGGATATADDTITVKDAALTASNGQAINAQQNQSTGDVVTATFTDANSKKDKADFTATIDWGDSHTSAGTVSVADNGTFSVTGSHTYTTTGSFTVKTSISDTGGSKASATAAASVAAPPTLATTGVGWLIPPWAGGYLFLAGLLLVLGVLGWWAVVRNRFAWSSRRLR